MPFFKFFDLPIEIRCRVYELHVLELPCIVNVGLCNQLSRARQISAPSGSPIELLCVSQDASREAARVIYRRTTFECAGAHEFSFFLASLSDRFRAEVKHVRFTQPTRPYQQIEFYMHELQNMYTIERVFSAERSWQLPHIPTELRSIGPIPSNTEFLQICRQEEQFASTFVEKGGPGTFKLVRATRSENAEETPINDDFNITIQRLHYQEKAPDIRQGRAGANLGFRQAAVLAGGQCYSLHRHRESGFL